jgi:two-component system nitrogen regulation response regulator NtrX
MMPTTHPIPAARHAGSSVHPDPSAGWHDPDPAEEAADATHLTPAAVEALLARACYVLGLPAKTFGAGAAEVLAAISWDGHPQDLRAFVASLAQRVDAGQIILADVLAELQITPRLPHGHAHPLPGRSSGAAAPLREARQRFERQYVQQVLEEHRYNVREAAAVLGIQRTNLYRKLKSLRLRAAIDVESV